MVRRNLWKITAFALIVVGSATAQEFLNKLPKVGSKAPVFKLKQVNNKTVDFAQEFKKNKATIVNFWFYS